MLAVDLRIIHQDVQRSPGQPVDFPPEFNDGLLFGYVQSKAIYPRFDEMVTGFRREDCGQRMQTSPQVLFDQCFANAALAAASIIC